MTISLTMDCNQTTDNNYIPRIINIFENGVSIAGLSGLECYSVYKAKTQDNHKTTADVVVPYITDTIAMTCATQYMSFDSSALASTMLSMK